jgi:hypothetical protein
MTYVEWLRVRGCLKWMAIVLLCGVGLLLVGRFVFLDIGPHQSVSGLDVQGVNVVELEKVSKMTQTKLPDGTTRTIYDDAKAGIRMTIDDHGYWGKHVEIFESHPPADAQNKTESLGDVSFRRTGVPGGSLLTVDLNAPEDLAYYFTIATFIALIAATVLGAPFARENDGHLELAFTKPVSRLPLSLQIVGVDFAGIAIAWAMAVTFLIVGHTIFEAPRYYFGADDAASILLGFLGAFSWYAMLCAATASLKRAYGVILGIAWPIALVVYGLSEANLGDSAVGQLVHYAATALAWISPYTYVQRAIDVTSGGQSIALLFGSTLPMLSILALVYGALAIAQWQRVEA